jgi:hypothetical protein
MLNYYLIRIQTFYKKITQLFCQLIKEFKTNNKYQIPVGACFDMKKELLVFSVAYSFVIFNYNKFYSET